MAIMVMDLEPELATGKDSEQNSKGQQICGDRLWIWSKQQLVVECLNSKQSQSARSRWEDG